MRGLRSSSTRLYSRNRAQSRTRFAHDPQPVSRKVGFVADAQAGNGLGHISRCSAVALALSCRGVDHRCYAFGSPEPIERDRVHWERFEGANDRDVEGEFVVFDSYVMDEHEQLAIAAGRPIVVMHEGRPVDHAALAVNTTLPPSDDDRHLYGLRYAALRPPFWGVVRDSLPDRIRTVLVSLGASDGSGLTISMARLALRVIPDARVRVVRGPRAAFAAPPGVEVIDAPADLLRAFLATDLAICSGGQTSLEAAATGTPSVTLSLAPNQKPNTELLERLGVTIAPNSDHEDGIESALRQLADDPDRRREMSERARSVVDGNGALRVAFRIAELMG